MDEKIGHALLMGIIEENGAAYDCICGSTVTNVNNHFKTDKHRRQFNVEHTIGRRIFSVRDGNLFCRLCDEEFEINNGSLHLLSPAHIQNVRNTRAQGAGGNDQDAGGNDQDAGGNEQDAGNNDQDAGGNDQDAGNNDQDAGGNDQDAGNNDQDAGNNDQDAGNNDQDAARNDHGGDIDLCLRIADLYTSGQAQKCAGYEDTLSINAEYLETTIAKSNEMKRLNLSSPILIAGGTKIVLCDVLCFVSSVCDWPAQIIADQLVEYYQEKTIVFAYTLACLLSSKRLTRCNTTAGMAKTIVSIVVDELVHNANVVLATTDMNTPINKSVKTRNASVKNKILPSMFKRTPDTSKANTFMDSATQTDTIVTECACNSSINDISCQLEAITTMLKDHQSTINMFEKTMLDDSTSGIIHHNKGHYCCAPTAEYDDVMPTHCRTFDAISPYQIPPFSHSSDIYLPPLTPIKMTPQEAVKARHEGCQDLIAPGSPIPATKIDPPTESPMAVEETMATAETRNDSIKRQSCTLM